MKLLKLTKTLSIAAAALTLVACATGSNGNSSASTSNSGSASAQASATTGGVSFAHSLSATHQATKDAMAVLGCNVNEDTSNLVKCKRPNKIGFFVGSGGETIIVSLNAVSSKETEAKISTKKSLVGIVGQKNWDSQMAEEMKKALNK